MVEGFSKLCEYSLSDDEECDPTYFTRTKKRLKGNLCYDITVLRAKYLSCKQKLKDFQHHDAHIKDLDDEIICLEEKVTDLEQEVDESNQFVKELNLAVERLEGKIDRLEEYDEQRTSNTEEMVLKIEQLNHQVLLLELDAGCCNCDGYNSHEE